MSEKQPLELSRRDFLKVLAAGAGATLGAEVLSLTNNGLRAFSLLSARRAEAQTSSEYLRLPTAIIPDLNYAEVAQAPENFISQITNSEAFAQVAEDTATLVSQHLLEREPDVISNLSHIRQFFALAESQFGGVQITSFTALLEQNEDDTFRPSRVYLPNVSQEGQAGVYSLPVNQDQGFRLGVESTAGSINFVPLFREGQNWQAIEQGATAESPTLVPTPTPEVATYTNPTLFTQGFLLDQQTSSVITPDHQVLAEKYTEEDLELITAAGMFVKEITAPLIFEDIHPLDEAGNYLGESWQGEHAVSLDQNITTDGTHVYIDEVQYSEPLEDRYRDFYDSQEIFSGVDEHHLVGHLVGILGTRTLGNTGLELPDGTRSETFWIEEPIEVIDMVMIAAPQELGGRQIEVTFPIPADFVRVGVIANDNDTEPESTQTLLNQVYPGMRISIVAPAPNANFDSIQIQNIRIPTNRGPEFAEAVRRVVAVTQHSRFDSSANITSTSFPVIELLRFNREA